MLAKFTTNNWARDNYVRDIVEDLYYQIIESLHFWLKIKWFLTSIFVIYDVVPSPAAAGSELECNTLSSVYVYVRTVQRE